MEGLIVGIILVLVLAGVIVYMKVFRTTEKHDIVQGLISLGIDANVLAKFKHDYTTPGGCPIKSTVVIPPNFLALADEGLTRMIRNSTRIFPTWTKFGNISDYKIIVIDPMGINVENTPGSPHLKVKGISTAGTCLGVNRFSELTPTIVIPHQEGQNWNFEDYWMRSVWHEGEHCREYICDLGIFYYWAHAGDQHPHYSDTEGTPGFMSRNVAALPCALDIKIPLGATITTPPNK